jgi:hypothetical protein
MNYKFILGSCLVIGTSLLGYQIYKKEINYEKEYRNKIKNLLIEKGELNKDVHKRSIKSEVIDELVEIAKDLDIKLRDLIDDKTFDNLYKKYIEKMIIKSTKI